jgi:alkanesulfonate monooxygenase SsuD/methylene tetrahydromethanopterin reductase-like flavin-dependent oxidoreductase (luciferase family)
MAAGIDIVSQGRLTLGIGGGWYEREYQEYGYTFPAKPAVRIRQMEEAVRLITAMWTEKRANYDGKYFHVRDAILEPKPVQRPHPPIMIGGSGEQLTLRAVARVGDACNIFGDPEIVQHKLEVLRRHCEAEGRKYEAIERTNLTSLLLARDEKALSAKKTRLGLADPIRGYALTTAQAAELVGRYREAGSQMFICSFTKNDWESMELMAEEVMPRYSRD